MKNIYLIPTDKPSKICKHKDEFHFVIDGVFNLDREKYNLYITSDEKIDNDTEPCWCVNTIKNTWNGDVIYYQGTMPMYHYNGFKKVILTTDEDLIKDGVQKIDDEFLQWFIKNNSCEFAEVEKLYRKERNDTGMIGSPMSFTVFDKYKIIIPEKEEQKQHIIEMMQDDEELGLYETNWMTKRMYSEEEVFEMLRDYDREFKLDTFAYTKPCTFTVKEWFEQFKK